MKVTVFEVAHVWAGEHALAVELEVGLYHRAE
jgi:hypothetical protein